MEKEKNISSVAKQIEEKIKIYKELTLGKYTKSSPTRAENWGLKLPDTEAKELEAQLAYAKNVLQAGPCKISLLVYNELLEEAKEELRFLQEEELPEILRSNGLNSLELADGTTLKQTETSFASIPQDQTYAVYSELVAEYGEEYAKNYFKKQLIFSDLPEDLKAIITSYDVDYEEKLTIHAQTVRRLVNELTGESKKIPMGISTYIKQTVNIKER